MSFRVAATRAYQTTRQFPVYQMNPLNPFGQGFQAMRFGRDSAEEMVTIAADRRPLRARASRQNPASKTIVVAAPEVKPRVEVSKPEAANKAVPVQSKKSLWQTVTQPKVLIAAGIVLAVVGVVAFYYICPVAAAAVAPKLSLVGRAAIMHSQKSLMSGITYNALLVNTMMKTVITPTLNFSMPIVSKVVGTAIISTLGTIAIVKIGTRAYLAAKHAFWGVGTTAVNIVSDELDKTYLGMGIKMGVKSMGSALSMPMELIAGTEDDSDQASMSEEVRPKKKKQRKTSSAASRIAGTILLAGLGAGVYWLYSKSGTNPN